MFFCKPNCRLSLYSEWGLNGVFWLDGALYGNYNSTTVKLRQVTSQPGLPILEASTHRFRQSAEPCASNILFHCIQYNCTHQRRTLPPPTDYFFLCCSINSIGDSTGSYAMFAASNAPPVCRGNRNCQI